MKAHIMISRPPGTQNHSLALENYTWGAMRQTRANISQFESKSDGKGTPKVVPGAQFWEKTAPIYTIETTHRITNVKNKHSALDITIVPKLRGAAVSR